MIKKNIHLITLILCLVIIIIYTTVNFTISRNMIIETREVTSKISDNNAIIFGIMLKQDSLMQIDIDNLKNELKKENSLKK